MEYLSHGHRGHRNRGFRGLVGWSRYRGTEERSGRGCDAREKGPTLPFPYSSGITGSTKLRELRVQHAGKPYRVLYAFDPKRNAILLLGGNKAGTGRWYETYVSRAQKLFAAYLKESGQAE
jgi:hypothetical protein